MKSLAPKTEEEASAIIAVHAARREPLVICGNGTRSGYGNPVAAEARLQSSELAGIVAYTPHEMVMTARSGTPVAVVEEVLATKNQMLAFEPVDHRALMGTIGAPTIGGVFAANVSGPRRIVAGGARDSLLGARFVNGKGQIVRAGGRVMKNVTGLDLAKLVAGSHGTLGLLTEVTFRVLPRPMTETTVLILGLAEPAATSAMAAAMALSVEVSAAAHLPVTREGGGYNYNGEGNAVATTALRLEGTASSVEGRVVKLLRAMSAFGSAARLDPDRSAMLWRSVRNVSPFCDGSARPLWRVSVAPSSGHRLVAALRKTVDVDAFYDWQGGLIWLRTEGDPHADVLRGHLKAFGGHATLLRASAEARRAVPSFEPSSDSVSMLSRKIKESFDPAGILNPGKMG
ncbi:MULTISPECIES: FAD-binding protein [Ensifer]|uniref:FAD-binding protein n=1 Tax=Ensifer adhaerens TaxID=106592 RepID=A0A9Q8YEG3_ENSAD|nr:MULTISPECIES: FAD-binding protein [Ensifer]KQX52545.1 2-hydroxy-acid oxidase [Ensifer sp. Root1298]KQX85390.1 2-hydroxy-acid oxidase [Ensifer sp. Root1312]KRC18929.1 2-hydroxy-acid oxidase [Ensifer sp. Root74]KRD76739.1 2-hydroxy-acid oxidase [Ensifer sp. Root954]USJ27750.1 FAD-binding protein [Ensifer adhaerens]